MSISSSAVARVDYLVIGSGVVGLAISRALSLKSINNSIITIDKNHTFGLETSSRNSQVIHGKTDLMILDILFQDSSQTPLRLLSDS